VRFIGRVIAEVVVWCDAAITGLTWLLRVALLPAALAAAYGLLKGWNDEIEFYSRTRSQLLRDGHPVEPEVVLEGREVVLLAIGAVGVLTTLIVAAALTARLLDRVLDGLDGT
jgi:hypothetical protein